MGYFWGAYYVIMYVHITIGMVGIMMVRKRKIKCKNKKGFKKGPKKGRK